MYDNDRSILPIPHTPQSKLHFEDSDLEDYDIEDNADQAPYNERRATGLSILPPSGLRSRSISPLSHSHSSSRRQSTTSPPVHLSTPFHEHPRPHTLPQLTKNSPLASSLSRFWSRNGAVLLVACAQLFGATMNLCTRLLELDGENPMHPFQILFFRMSITTVCSCAYMWYTEVPHFPWGAKEVRVLLVARGMTGFFGIYGMWWSMMYLPLAEATVITFLAPAFTGYICHRILKDPYTKKEQIASFLALAGVVLIARPTSLFGGSDEEHAPPPENPGGSTGTAGSPGEDGTASRRLLGVGIAMIGVLGASGAYTFIRWIGKRAHPLISVTYFSVWSTIVSTAALLVAPMADIGQPAVRFAWPASAFQWMLLLSLGLCGFVMQFMLTSGIGGKRSNKAMAMVYTHMLFAAGYDKWVFGHDMGIVSVVGCGLIVGSALWAALSKKEKEEEKVTGGALELEEQVPMLEARELEEGEVVRARDADRS